MANRRWTKEDIAAVVSLWEAGVDAAEIGAQLGATADSIRHTAKRVGAKRPEWFAERGKFRAGEASRIRSITERLNAAPKPHHPAMARFGAVLLAATRALDLAQTPTTGTAARRAHARAVEEAIKIARGDHGVEDLGAASGWP